MSSIDNSRPLKNQTIINIALFVLLLFLTNDDIGSISGALYWAGVLGSCLIIFVFSYSRHGSVEINSFFVWLLVFFSVCLLSTLYSINISNSIDLLKSLMLNTVALSCVLWSIKSKEELISTIKTYVSVTVFNTIYLMLTIDWGAFGEDRLNPEITGEGWNANSIGMMMIWGAVFCFYLIKALGQKRYYFAMLLFLPLIIYSGSRKVWLGAIAIILLIVFLNNKKKLFKALIISALIIIVIYQLLINVDFLYNVGGERFEQLINGVLGKGEYDHSTELRFKYIELGMGWFKERPLFGYGINCFRTLLNNATGHSTYSHNNYVELLVSVGLVGCIIFYSIYFILIRNVFSLLKNSDDSDENKKSQAIICLFSIVLILIFHYGSVSFESMTHIMLALMIYKHCQINALHDE